MCKFKFPCIILLGMFCSIDGQAFGIKTKFSNGNLIFSWTNTTHRKEIYFTDWKDLQIGQVEYTVQDVMQYESVWITIRDYNTTVSQGYVDYDKTYKVNKVQSKQGETRNISWTIDIFPKSGDYKVFHNGTNGMYLQINLKRTTNHIYLRSQFNNSTKMVLEISNITLADAGHYIGGTSFTDAKTRGEDAVLIVYANPLKPNITGVLNVKAGDYATLTCESRSTSAPNYYKFPPLSYVWFVNNTRVQREIGKIYRFIVSKDVKNNRYSCQAKESVRPLKSDKSEEIQINPLYGPESVTVTNKPPIVGLSIHDGETFGPYTCSADCNPPCTVQWKFKHPSGVFKMATSPGKSTVTVTEQKANRTSMAGIRCEVNGTAGKNVSDIKLNIQYLLDPKVFINGIRHNSYTMNESDPLHVTCMVEGNPTPGVTVGKLTGVKIPGKNQLNFTLSREAQCSDTGNYSCEGKSDEFSSKYQSFSINVLCFPKLDESMASMFKTKYGSMSGPDVFLVVAVPVIANPTPSLSMIKWSGLTSQLTSVKVSQRDNVVYKHWINSTISVPHPRSFGNFSLMYNGKIIAEITIDAEDKPQPPLNFSWHPYVPGFINLTWVSDFNGGPEQFFILSRKDGSSWTFVENLTDPGKGSMGHYDVGSLTPGQEYLYQLESCNRINCSLTPKEVKVKVKAPPISSSSLFGDNTLLILVGASAAGFLLVVVLTLAVTMYCKTTKKSATKKRNREERLSGSSEQDDTQADVVVYAAVDKSVLMKNRQQADVVQSDVIKDQNDYNDTMYSEVIKHPKKQKQTDEKKKKNVGKELQGKNEEAGTSTSNDKSRSTNQDGLLYIDVEFAKKPQSSDTKGRPVIHGEDEKTEYTFVDFSQKAPPVQETQENVK